jgi:hypothetical protein
VDAGFTLPFVWPSYNYSLWRFIIQNTVTCVLVLNCNCSGTVTSGLTLFWNCDFGTILLSQYFADWIQNTYFDTTAASLFVTGETTVKAFIPVVTVYYLRVAALTRLSGPFSSNGRLL